MAAPLPHHIQQKLEQTIAQWPHWQCDPPLNHPPAVVTLLTRGIGNHSVLVESGQRFVVRIDGLNPSANGLNRQCEWRTLADAHDAGIAPRPRYFNPELGSIVCDYLPHDAEQAMRPTEVAALLRAIHQLPARHHRLDLGERIRCYEKLLAQKHDPAGREVLQYRDKVVALLGDSEDRTSPSVLCHNDLLRANRLYSGGRLWALDWEYCAMGSPLYDLAVVIHGDDLSPAQSDALIAAYLGSAPDRDERADLERYGCLYRYLELLWYLALDRPPPGVGGIEGKLARLDALLN